MFHFIISILLPFYNYVKKNVYYVKNKRFDVFFGDFFVWKISLYNNSILRDIRPWSPIRWGWGLGHILYVNNKFKPDELARFPLFRINVFWYNY